MKALIRLAAAAVAATACTITNAASFDCTKAKSLTEKLICTDADLSSRDDSLAAVFARAKATARDPVEFQREARAAWNWREKNCKDAECLRQWYAERTSLYADRSQGYSNRAPANPDLSVKPSPQRVSAAQLYYAYRNNAFAADSTYMGKELSVDSVILNIIKTDGGDPVLILGYGAHEPHAVAKFDKSSIPQIATLGQQVAIRAECIGGGMLNNLPLLFCQTAKRM